MSKQRKLEAQKELNELYKLKKLTIKQRGRKRFLETWINTLTKVIVRDRILNIKRQYMTKKQAEIAEYCRQYRNAEIEIKKVIYKDAFNMIPPCEPKECEVYINLIEKNLNYYV